MATPLPKFMRGVLLTGHGGIDKLEYREDIPLPRPSADEVLVRLTAAAINNTDINTRSGWYDDSVRVATSEGGSEGFRVASESTKPEPTTPKPTTPEPTTPKPTTPASSLDSNPSPSTPDPGERA